MKRKLENNIGSILATPKYTECYTNLAKDRIIFVSEDITKDTASSLSALLFHYDNENEGEDISLYINTNGGDASALSNIYDIMRLVKAPIKTICVGKAYSAGAFMLAAGTKGKRFMTKNASVMIHGIQCEFPSHGSEDRNGSQIYFDFLTKLNRIVLETLAVHTGKTYEQIYEDTKKDKFMTAEECLEYGIVDYIL
jgi:ATP-dependent Clp protease protease subunit